MMDSDQGAELECLHDLRPGVDFLLRSAPRRISDKLVAYAPGSGAEKEVDPGPQVMQALQLGSLVAVHHDDRRVVLFDAASEKRVAQKRFRDLDGAKNGGVVAART